MLKFEILKYLRRLYVRKYFFVAYSGGLDSCILLNLLLNCKDKKFNYTIIVLHVNHHYCNIFSDFWEYFCIKFYFFCPIIIAKVKNLQQLTFRQSENHFRLLRLFAFEAIVIKKISIILFAHHRNDQEETILYDLFYGKYIFGLTIKAFINGYQCFRPFLYCTKKFFLCCVKKYTLSWVTDSSNFSIFILRNFLRILLLPALTTICPFFSNSIVKFIYYSFYYYKLLYHIREFIFLNICDSRFDRININKFLCLSIFLKKETLRYWFLKILFSIEIVNKKKLLLYFNILLSGNYFFLIFNKYFFFRFHNYIYFIVK